MLVFDPLKLSMLDYKLSFGSYIFKTPFLLPNILWSSHCDRVHMWSWLKVWHTDHTGLWPSVSHMPFGVVTLRDRSLSSAMLLEVKLPVCLKFTASTGLYLSTVSLKPIKLQSATRECSYRCQQCMSAPMAASNTWVLPWLPATRECSHGCTIFLIQCSQTLILCTWWGSLTYPFLNLPHSIKQQVFLSCFSCSDPRWYTLFLLIRGRFHMILILGFDRHCRCYFLGCCSSLHML